MVSQKIIVKNPSGLHARPAAMLAKAAGKCKSEVLILANGKTVKAKSVLNIMTAGIKTGTEIELQCNGETQESDLAELIALIASGLGE